MVHTTHLPFLVSALVMAFTAVVDAQAETIVINDAQLTWVDDVNVACRDAGIVVRVGVRPNDNVNTSSVLVELDNGMRIANAEAAEQRWSIALEESESEIDSRLARKRAQVVKSALERGRTAIEKYQGAISRAEMELLELEYDEAVLAEEQAQHDLVVNKLTAGLRSSEYEMAQLQLKHRTIHSPLKGQVVDVDVQVGEWVSEGQPVARVVNLDRLRIIALMPERNVYAVSIGQPAEWKIQLNEKTITAKGRVSFVSPEINPVSREFTMWVDVENVDGKLRSGFVGTLTLQSD